MWPSRSSKPCPYMKPWSLEGFGTEPPAARAYATNSSTFARLSQDKHTRTSVLLVASQIAFLVKVLKKLSTSSMTKMLSPTIMQVAFSSVNCGLNLKPRLVKKAMERCRLFTGMFTKICAAIRIPFQHRIAGFPTAGCSHARKNAGCNRKIERKFLTSYFDVSITQDAGSRKCLCHSSGNTDYNVITIQAACVVTPS